MPVKQALCASDATCKETEGESIGRPEEREVKPKECKFFLNGSLGADENIINGLAAHNL